MSTLTVNPKVPLITGASHAYGANAIGTTCDTVIIAPTTAQSILDFSKLAVRFQNLSSVAVSITPLCGTTYSAIGEGNGAAVTLGTSTSATAVILIGGASFESARFQNSSDQAGFTLTTGASVYVDAIMLP
jgi:hypothetical protein